MNAPVSQIDRRVAGAQVERNAPPGTPYQVERFALPRVFESLKSENE